MATPAAKPAAKVELNPKFVEALKKRTELSEAEIQKSFEQFRTQGHGGKLTKEDFIKLWSEISPKVGHTDVAEIADRVFSFFDRDHSGKIDFSEFMLANCLLTPGKPTQKLALLFILCDFDHDGFISRKEIEQMFWIPKAGIKKSWEQELKQFQTHLDAAMAQYDANKDGKISQKEFRNLCTNDEVFKKLVEESHV